MRMMKLSCKDLKPDVDCAFEATGETATDAAIREVKAELGMQLEVGKIEFAGTATKSDKVNVIIGFLAMQ